MKAGNDKQLLLKDIVRKVENGTNKTIQQLKKELNEEQLFNIGLKYVTTTKKAYCTALKIPVEAGCRYKRTSEKQGRLVQSIDEVICPYTKHFAHLISTNPNEFEKLQTSSSNQLKLF